MTRERLKSVLPSKPAHLDMLTDVDTKDDLDFIPQEMPQKLNNSQKKLMVWIGETHD